MVLISEAFSLLLQALQRVQLGGFYFSLLSDTRPVIPRLRCAQSQRKSRCDPSDGFTFTRLIHHIVLLEYK